jgi:hypothetical protein
MVLQNAEKHRGEESKINDVDIVYRGVSLPKNTVDDFIKFKNI